MNHYLFWFKLVLKTILVVEPVKTSQKPSKTNKNRKVKTSQKPSKTNKNKKSVQFFENHFSIFFGLFFYGFRSLD